MAAHFPPDVVQTYHDLHSLVGWPPLSSLTSPSNTCPHHCRSTGLPAATLFCLQVFASRVCSAWNRTKVTITVLDNTSLALAGVTQWIEHWPANRKVTGSLLHQGTCLGYRPGLQLGVCKRQLIDDVSLTHRCFSALLSPSFPLSKKQINKNKMLL